MRLRRVYMGILSLTDVDARSAPERNVTVLSSHSQTLQAPAAASSHSNQCSAVNDRVHGLAVCSLASAPHSTHQLRCEETGELVGEWTDADRTFRLPNNEFQRYVEFGDTPDLEIHYGDVA